MLKTFGETKDFSFTMKDWKETVKREKETFNNELLRIIETIQEASDSLDLFSLSLLNKQGNKNPNEAGGFFMDKYENFTKTVSKSKENNDGLSKYFTKQEGK